MPARLQLSLQWGLSLGPSKIPAWPISRPRIRRLLTASLGAQAQAADITVRVVGQKEAQKLNQDYRQKDYPPNILTFCYETLPVIRADLVICLPIIRKEARAQKKDVCAHFSHMLVHGMLHAQGLDHLTDLDAQHMEALERQILKRFRLPDPYSVH